MKDEKDLLLAIGSMRAAAKIIADGNAAAGKPRDTAEEFCYTAILVLEWVYDGRDHKGLMERFLNIGASSLYEQFQKTGDDPHAMVPLMTPTPEQGTEDEG